MWESTSRSSMNEALARLLHIDVTCVHSQLKLLFVRFAVTFPAEDPFFKDASRRDWAYSLRFTMPGEEGDIYVPETFSAECVCVLW